MAGEDDKVSTDATEKGPVIGTIKKDKLKFAKKLKSRLGKKKEQKNAPISGSELAKSQRSKRFVRNIALPISAVVVFTVGAYFLYGFIQDRKTIVIGDSKITHEQRSSYADQLQKYMAKTGESADKSAKDVALDAFILNAALKDQAKKHGITVSEADIDAALASDYDIYGGKEAFWDNVKSSGIDRVTPIVRENEVYKQKLGHVLLNRKDIFVVDIHYGSPYFQHYQEHNGDAEPLREKARQLLKNKFLPLFERGVSKEEIASLVVDNRVVPNASNVDLGQAPFDETTTVAIMLENFNRTAGTRFNDEEGDKSIPGVVSANEVAASLKKAGDHTGVVTTLAGTISIMRAEEVRGGDYDSWDDLLAEYRQKYAENKLKLTVTRWSNNVARITENFVGQLSVWLLPKASATHANPTPAQCASDFHLVKWKWAARNANTGAYVPGARVSYKRASNYVKTCPNGIKAEAGGSIPQGGYLVTDNCWEHPPDVSFTNPAGYTRANPFATENGGDHFDNNGVPRWDKGKNAIVMEAAILNFLPPPTVSNWQLEGKSYVNNQQAITVKRGDQLKFKHTVTNTGSVSSSTISFAAAWVTGIAGYNLSTIPACNPTGPRSEIIAAGGIKYVPSPGEFTCNVPNNAANGTTYCQQVGFTPKSSSSNTTGTSTPACATVVDPGQPCTVPCCPGQPCDPGGDPDPEPCIPGTGDPRCPPPPPPPNLDPEVSLSGVFEPGETVTAKASVIKSMSSDPARSKYQRIFWYEMNGDDKYGSGDVVVGPVLLGTVLSNHLKYNYTTLFPVTYSDGTNSLADWDIKLADGPSYQRICTSLRVFELNPSDITVTSPNPQTDCQNISKKPYFQVENGDVNAAAAMLPSCAPSSNNKISAYNRGSSGSYSGSGTQIAAFSYGLVNEFVSDSKNAAGGPPMSLTFANNTGTWGGNFNSNYCLPDYWAGITDSLNRTAGNSSADVLTNGDVHVTGSPAINSFTLGSTKVRWVIAKNIYINASVTNLDGIYIAKENIYTCSSGFTPHKLTGANNMASSCDKQLKVRGALIAGNSVKLQRTYGTLSRDNDPAELIEYNPFVWMHALKGGSPLPGIGNSSNKLDFITTLPPIL